MSGPTRVLIIEDDPAIRRGLVDALKFESFHVFEAGTAKIAMELATTVDCHLILLDLLLPGGDGLLILRKVRETRPTLPVIILTARGDESERIKGLQLGADDYVVKPFSVKELIARIHAVLRRSPGRPLDVVSVRFPPAKIEADLLRRELRFDGGGRVELSEKEAELLRYLACNPTRAISREELLRGVWQLDSRGVETRTIDMHVARLREKLRDDAEEPRLLLTVRNKGYMLAADAISSGGNAMSRTQLTWMIFAGALALIFTVMTFFTAKMLNFENAMADAETRAALEENVRLALWRMDSAAPELIAHKSREPLIISPGGNPTFTVSNSNPNFDPVNSSSSPLQDLNSVQRIDPNIQQQKSAEELQQRASLSRSATGDWRQIEPALLDRISDILPGATLEPVSGKDVDPNDTRRLASIPARLVLRASELPSPSPPWNTPLRISLMISWSCVILAALGVAKLLGATLALSERRGAFASAVTHELRTPMTTCRMYAEMLASGMITDPAARQQYLDTLLAESDRLGHLIENVLTYSQLERRISPNRAQTIGVRELIDPVLAVLHRRVQQAGFQLEVRITPDAASAACRTDPTAVQQILLNLVDNACKYGQPPIELVVVVAGKNVEFSIIDHGPGVDSSRARHLFSAFNKSKTSTIPGIGLGLYLSRRLARGLGGDLTLVSTQIGANFAFTLPRTVAQAGQTG